MCNKNKPVWAICRRLYCNHVAVNVLFLSCLSCLLDLNHTGNWPDPYLRTIPFNVLPTLSKIRYCNDSYDKQDNDTGNSSTSYYNVR